jgi:hypothetical protein
LTRDWSTAWEQDQEIRRRDEEEKQRRTDEIKAIRGENKENYETINKNLGAILERFERQIEDLKSTQVSGQYEEVREYIDDDGKICDPKEAVSVRVRRVPTAPKESTEVKEFREEIKGLHMVKRSPHSERKWGEK